MVFVFSTAYVITRIVEKEQRRKMQNPLKTSFKYHLEPEPGKW